MNKFCGQCGEKLLQSSKFCGQCGVKTDTQSVSTKDNFNKKELSIEKDVKPKNKGRNLYSIIGVLIFVLIFGSRAIYTTYRNQQTYELVLPPDDYDNFVDLIIDKDWKLKSYSNITSETAPSMIDFVKNDLTEAISDDNNVLNYSTFQEMGMDNLLISHTEGWNEEFGEIMAVELLCEYTEEAEGFALFSEGNKMISYGVNSEREDIMEYDFKAKDVIVDIDKSSMKIHHNVKGNINGIDFDIDWYATYAAK
ncbi:hypothetical protein N9488_01415 [Flavobacteriales bacterium]|nr:hypothetical protein [Flavobacteriales bacterium]